jgi:spore maturation protein CgeB
MSQKILIYGENWVGTLPNLLKNALVEKGYKAKVFDWTHIMPGIRNRSYVSRAKRNLFLNYYNNKIQNAFYLEADDFKPDTIIISKGLSLSPKFIQRLQAQGFSVHNWNPDDFFNLKNSNQNLIKSMPYYDSIITARKHLFDSYKTAGAKKLIYADWYYEPSLHFPTKTGIKREVSFVGSWSPSRESFIEQINVPVDVWGGGWEKAKSNINANHNIHNHILSQLEMSEVFCSSRFNINLLTNENADMSNLRMFEVPASGGLLLTPRNSFSENLFKKGAGCYLFETVDDVNSIIKNNDDNREEKRTHGYHTITDGKHTFSDRVNHVMCELLK